MHLPPSPDLPVQLERSRQGTVLYLQSTYLFANEVGVDLKIIIPFVYYLTTYVQLTPIILKMKYICAKVVDLKDKFYKYNIADLFGDK